MIEHLLKKAEWGELRELLAPSFFRVVPARALLGTGKRLFSASRDRKGFAAACAERQSTIAALGLPITLGPDESSSLDGLDGLDETAKKARGELVLALYFHELLDDGPWIFDFRSEAFHGAESGLKWTPKPWFSPLAPEFRGALGQIYRGFYGEDDALFRAGLAALGLTVAEEEFRAQFGTGDQRAVRFSVRTFQESFTAVFKRCREHGVSLAPDFLVMGLGLALLYDHLERLDVAFDVRAAFQHGT